MTSKLSKSLLKLASKTVNSKTTVSDYYQIGCIKVRVSDHVSYSPNYDLAIYSNGKSTYCVMPNIGTRREMQWFTSVKQTIDFIIQFEKFARMLLKPYEPICRDFGNGKVCESHDAWKVTFQCLYDLGHEYADKMDCLYEKSKSDSKIENALRALGPKKRDKKIETINQLLGE